jgi:hypothetical protein
LNIVILAWAVLHSKFVEIFRKCSEQNNICKIIWNINLKAEKQEVVNVVWSRLLKFSIKFERISTQFFKWCIFCQRGRGSQRGKADYHGERSSGALFLPVFTRYLWIFSWHCPFKCVKNAFSLFSKVLEGDGASKRDVNNVGQHSYFHPLPSCIMYPLRLLHYN